MHNYFDRSTFEIVMGGATKETRIAMSDLPLPRLVAPLAEEVARLSNEFGGATSVHTVKKYRLVIRDLVNWTCANSPQTQTLSGLTFRNFYSVVNTFDSDGEAKLRRLLVSASENQTGMDAPSTDLARHAAGTNVNQRKKSTPLSPYSKSEIERLKDACRSEVQEWREARAALETLAANESNSSAIAAAKKRLGTADQLMKSGSLAGKDERRVFTIATGAFYPELTTLLAYRILIGLELGLPAESIDTLKVTDISWSGPRTMRVSYTKNRAHGLQTALYSNAGPWSGPSLVQELCEALAPARENLSTSSLWPTPRVEEGFVSRWATQTRARRKLVGRHVLKDDFGEDLSLDMRRLRTTWTARKSREWNGLVTIDPNRSPRVEGDHYLTKSVSQDAIHEAISRAQRELEILGRTTPRVVASEEELAASLAQSHERAANDSAAATREWNMFAALCADPFSGEHGKAGDICPATVWACLSCRLSFFTPAHLPNLIRLRAHMQERFDDMPLSDWMSTYASAYVLLTKKVLPAFPATQVAAAERTVQCESPLLIPGTELGGAHV